jgi:hypothetical protein
LTRVYNQTLYHPLPKIWAEVKNLTLEKSSPFGYKDEVLISSKDDSASSPDWTTVGDSFTQILSMNDENQLLKYKVVMCQADRTYCKTVMFGAI